LATIQIVHNPLDVALYLCPLVSNELTCFIARNAGDVCDGEDLLSGEAKQIERVSLTLLDPQRSASQ
jgi:hypothetical protein